MRLFCFQSDRAAVDHQTDLGMVAEVAALLVFWLLGLVVDWIGVPKPVSESLHGSKACDDTKAGSGKGRRRVVTLITT